MNPNLTYTENRNIEARLRRENGAMKQALNEIANMDSETGHHLSDAIRCAQESLPPNAKIT